LSNIDKGEIWHEKNEAPQRRLTLVDDLFELKTEETGEDMIKGQNEGQVLLENIKAKMIENL
jgi:hypothetical protein